MSRRKLLVFYLLLLVASHVVRRFQDGTGPTLLTQEQAVLDEIVDGSRTGDTITIAWRDYAAPGGEEAPVLVLLHGSPGNSRQMDGLIRQFQGEARLIVPDLPGFGGSTRRIADYSVKAHAHYLARLLDRLAIPRAHLLGFSMGGGVAIEYADLAPEKTASLILVGSIGVQELELLGDYTLNHAVHGLQLAVIWLAQEAVPHFGVLDDMLCNHSYARNFFDTDQRPLRGMLNRHEAPALIIHGETDFLVPLSAAREHARILPQSDLAVLEDGHFRVFTDPESLKAPVLEFIGRVHNGEGTTRSSADPVRLDAARAPFDWDTHGHPRPVSATTMSILLALATFVSEDLACISAGILASRGAIPFALAVAACFAGIFFGDFLLYLAGCALGKKALRRAPFRWVISETDIERSAHFFHRFGPSLILTTRFIPGARLPTYFTAGLLGTGFWKFAGWFLLASALWTPLLVGLAWFVGGHLLDWFEKYERFTVIALVAIMLALLLVPKVVLPLLGHSGRRLLLSRWRRKTRWEFWPMWAFYPPVFLYILWLGIRHRKVTLFTAANPAIPGGGLALESKSEILHGFGEDVPEIARFAVIPASQSAREKVSLVDAFMHQHHLAFPVVLKPDIGERGQGVGIVKDHAEAEAYLDRCPHDVIVQEYVAGEEFGIFYYRYPEEKKGRIFSITDKRLIGVTGDGKRTLEELILDDDRAVCMARFFLDKFAHRLDDVPADGESVRLTELGTHCRGALFLDGRDVWTEQLEERIDALSKRFDGFYFGRYDVRATSREDLRRGTGFKVLELNGVTSEATHIYDPENSLLSAHAILREQWRIAFDIGRQNAKKGAKPYSVKEVVDLIQRFRHHNKFEA